MDDIFLKQIDELQWKTEVPNEEIILIRDKIYDNLILGKNKVKHFIRIAGQSGSGKTTQVTTALTDVFHKRKEKPFFLAVRDFAKFHPKFKQLFKDFGASDIREKTNGFALRLLVVTLIKAIADGYEIVLETTFLGVKFERCLLKLLFIFDYEVLNLLLCVNYKISNRFIEIRKNDAKSSEKSRNIYKKSSNFFYKAIVPSLKLLKKTFPYGKIVIWNNFNLEPIYVGKFQKALKVYKKNVKQKKLSEFSQSELQKAKVEFLNSYISWVK